MHALKRKSDWIARTKQRINKALADDSLSGWDMEFLADMDQWLSDGEDISDKQERRLVDLLVRTKATN